MKNKEPEVMKTLRRIRSEIHEELKDLPPEERIKKIKEGAESCKKRYGLKLRSYVKSSK